MSDKSDKLAGEYTRGSVVHQQRYRPSGLKIKVYQTGTLVTRDPNICKKYSNRNKKPNLRVGKTTKCNTFEAFPYFLCLWNSNKCSKVL